MTSGEVAKLTYQVTQPPLASPMRLSFTLGLALMKTSPWRSLPLIWLASALEPAAKPWKVSPEAVSKAGPMPCSMRFTSEPA